MLFRLTSWERPAQIACDTDDMPLFFAVCQFAYLGPDQSIARLAGKISCYSDELERGDPVKSNSTPCDESDYHNNYGDN